MNQLVMFILTTRYLYMSISVKFVAFFNKKIKLQKISLFNVDKFKYTKKLVKQSEPNFHRKILG